MSGLIAIFKRELLGLWVTPLAWVLLVSFLLLQGSVFYSITVHFAQMETTPTGTGPLNAYFGQQSLLMAFSLLLLCPPLTMRTLAEERRSGSMELLLSAPVPSSAIVIGKYSAIFSTYCLIWVPTLLYALTLRDTGTLHVPTLVSAYLGVGLVGASYLGIGVLMSALSKNQLTALLLSSSAIFALFVLGIGQYIFEPGPMRELGAYVSLTTLLEETSQGLIDSRRVVLHVSLTVWTLFVATRVVDSWRDA